MGKLKAILGGETQSMSVVFHDWILSVFLQLTLNKTHKATPDVFIIIRYLHECNMGKHHAEYKRKKVALAHGTRSFFTNILLNS